MERPAAGPPPHPSSPSRRSALHALAALALAAFASSACTAEVTYGQGPPAAPRAAARRGPPPPAPAPALAHAPAAPGAAPAGAWGAGDVPQADPEARRLFLSRASQPAAALSQAAPPPRVTALALANTARGEAQGMRSEEATASATLQEGERATLTVRIAPGECATFIAQGGLGVVEVDLFLTAGAGARGAAASTEVLVEDPTSGPIAVIGGRSGCFPNRGAGAIDAQLAVQVRRGGGVVLVQGYRGPAPAPLRPRPLPAPGR
jgi:hypothetical protein